MEQEKTIPPITIYHWPSLAMPETEIRNILMYLAYKTNKPITFRWYSDDEGYSENSVSVRVAVSDGCRKTVPTEAIRIGDSRYTPSENQVSVDIDVSVPGEKQILDDDFLVLAYVDHNRLIIPVELTASDNQETRAILSYIIEHSVELLDFKMTDKLLEQRKKLTERFCSAFARGVQDRINEKEGNLQDGERDAQSAYYTILDYERRKPVIQEGTEVLKEAPANQKAQTLSQASSSID